MPEDKRKGWDLSDILTHQWSTEARHAKELPEAEIEVNKQFPVPTGGSLRRLLDYQANPARNRALDEASRNLWRKISDEQTDAVNRIKEQESPTRPEGYAGMSDIERMKTRESRNIADIGGTISDEFGTRPFYYKASGIPTTGYEKTTEWKPGLGPHPGAGLIGLPIEKEYPTTADRTAFEDEMLGVGRFKRAMLAPEDERADILAKLAASKRWDPTKAADVEVYRGGIQTAGAEPSYSPGTEVAKPGFISAIRNAQPSSYSTSQPYTPDLRDMTTLEKARAGDLSAMLEMYYSPPSGATRASERKDKQAFMQMLATERDAKAREEATRIGAGAEIEATKLRTPQEKSLIGPISPGDFTPESIARFNQTGNYGDLRKITPGKQIERTIDLGDKQRVIYTDGTQEDIPKGLTPGASIGDVKADSRFAMNLRKEFNALQLVKDYRDVSTKYSIMQEAFRESQNTNNYVAIDQALITLYNKMTDPLGVVRESEYLRTSQDMAIMDKLKSAMIRVGKGGRLEPDTRQAIMIMANKFKNVYESKYNEIAKEYQGYANSAGISPDNVVKLKSRFTIKEIP